MFCHKWKENVTFGIIGRSGKQLNLAVGTGTSREELWLQTRMRRGIQDKGMERWMENRESNNWTTKKNLLKKSIKTRSWKTPNQQKLGQKRRAEEKRSNIWRQWFRKRSYDAPHSQSINLVLIQYQCGTSASGTSLAQFRTATMTAEWEQQVYLKRLQKSIFKKTPSLLHMLGK